MAPSSSCITPLLLLSLVIFASAYETKPKLQNPNPEGKEKFLTTKQQDGQPKLEEKEKSIPKKPKYEQPKSDEKVKFLPTKPRYEKPKPEEKDKYVPTKPNYGQPKPEEKVKSLPTKPTYAQPKPEGIKKKKIAPTKPVYDQKPKEIPTKSNYMGSPVPQQEKSILPLTTAVQGLVSCKSGLKYFPIQGAVAKITCIADYQEGYKTTTFSILSAASDAKGYFYATLSPSTLGDKPWKLKECKAYLDHSPLKSCNVPTNINDGIHGDLLSSYNILKHTSTKLFSVGPFYYTTSSSQPKSSVPTGAY
ncbi:proline-rich protein 3-like [Humulus lupulus]|uniref:proline-rich protein 3-like n=1 Tax=Humulus lupulus TaxID=3486 RepID=UPI002B414F8A|nr:proline-rich protein 3-like [Humulus lupulus]